MILFAKNNISQKRETIYKLTKEKSAIYHRNAYQKYITNNNLDNKHNIDSFLNIFHFYDINMRINILNIGIEYLQIFDSSMLLIIDMNMTINEFCDYIIKNATQYLKLLRTILLDIQKSLIQLQEEHKQFLAVISSFESPEKIANIKKLYIDDRINIPYMYHLIALASNIDITLLSHIFVIHIIETLIKEILYNLNKIERINR